jgi:hypothetical protein
MKTLRSSLFLATAFGLFSAALQAQVMYTLKESEPRVGTQIRAEILRSPLPFDKSYEELSPQQLAVLRSNYDKLDESDEPPYPEGGMRSIGNEIARLPRNPVARGPLVITVQVDDKGVAQSTQIYKTPNDELAKSISIILMKAKYKPAKCAGAPCEMDFPIIFEIGEVK